MKEYIENKIKQLQAKADKLSVALEDPIGDLDCEYERWMKLGNLDGQIKAYKDILKKYCR